MKRAIFSVLFSAIALTCFAQPNWQKGGNAQIPFASPSTLGTDASWNANLIFLTNGNPRMQIGNGLVAANDGRIAMGNNLAPGFIAQDRLHLHQTAGLVATRYSNTVTGSGPTQGFQVGIAALGGGIIQHYMPNRPISFGTNDGLAGIAYRMRVSPFQDNGFIAMGNVNNFPAAQSMLHIMMFAPNMANTAVRGEIFRTDGDNTTPNAWRMFTGLNAPLSTEKFSVVIPTGSNDATLNSINGDMLFYTNGASGVRERIHMSSGVGNQAGVAQPGATKVNINYGATYPPITNPVALLNLGFNPSPAPVGGQRAWMDVGTYTCAGSDNMYVGLKNEDPAGNIDPALGADRMDAVINWGDNNANTAPFGPDRLRFIFTNVQNPAQPSGAASNSGLEFMRMYPVSDLMAFVGIGGDPTVNPYSGPSIDPGNTLEVNSLFATNTLGGASGLRFTNCTAASPSTPNVANGNVLSVNASGDVILVPGGGVAFGGACGNINNMNADFEVPMNNFNYVFTGQGTGTNSVGIGMPAGFCTPLPAKLTVNQSVTSANSIGILSRNTGTSSCAIMAINTGTNVTPANPQVAGWFQASPTEYAIVVPKNGGMVSIGKTPNVTGPNYPWAPFVPNILGAMLDVGGSIYMMGTLVSTSDATLKHNVVTIPNALDKVLALRGVNFEWNTTDDSLMTGVHGGFIAQEVDSIIPEVVQTDGQGIMSIAYTEIIPYLVEALKEEHELNERERARNDSLSARVDSLISVVGGCCSSTARMNNSTNQQDVTLADTKSIVLNQNVPNPFAEQTTISFLLPESVVKAQILFYDAQGKLIKAVDVDARGAGQLNVFADDLSNGVYSYALVADGEVIDTKQMVKAK